MNKVLSVSIAGYNVEATLRETLEPFLHTNVLDKLDIMIVDDGSKDNTAQVAQEFVDKYPDSFRLISKKNGGWGSTVNSGIDNARGKYFKQLDGDDYYRPENMAGFIACLENTNADMVITPYISYNDQTGEQLSFEQCNPGCEQGKVYELAQIDSFMPFMHALCVRTDLLKDEKVKITENCFYTDTEFVLKALNQVHTVEFYDQVIYCYRRAAAGQSMSLVGFEKHHMEQYKVIQVLLQYKNEHVTRPEIKKLYDQLLYTTCLWHYLVMLYIKPTRQHKRELVDYDKMLKKMAPDYYERIDIGTVNKLRQFHFMGYTIAAIHKKKKDNRFTKDGRMLY